MRRWYGANNGVDFVGTFVVGSFWLVVGLVFVAVGLAGSALAADMCPNAALRFGPSADLPDCRAYELVTPANKGRTQDLTFTQGNDSVLPSRDGESIALESVVPLEPNPGTPSNITGTRAVFSRTPAGWVMKSVVAPGESEDHIVISGHGLLSPDLSQVAFESYTELNALERSPNVAFEVGPVGGPYARAVDVPREYATIFLGANAGTASVSPFTDVLLVSSDHALASSGGERAVAEGTVEGAEDLYDWVGGRLVLVNMTSGGTLLNKCGAQLGEGFQSTGEGAAGAISEDGSKIFFTSPQPEASERFGAGCPPSSLFMRVDGRETVEVSPLASVPASERRPVEYHGATPDGSEVFFSTVTPLTAGETAKERGENKLFEYNTVTGVLTLIASGLPSGGISGVTPYVVASGDGSTVYYKTGASSFENLSRYDTTRTGVTTHVATIHAGLGPYEPSYVSPNGEFLVFAARGKDNGGVLEDGVVGESRGAGHNELYRYDALDGSVMCVSCGQGVAPAEGEMLEPSTDVFGSFLKTQDGGPGFVQMSDDGRKVFFQSTARLVRGDTNSTETDISSGTGVSGLDVYEWEADGVEVGPGVFCEVAVGCTFLLSAGEDDGPSVFLGADGSGRDVFFSSASRLAPQDTDEAGDIYDAREDGGFPVATSPVECLSCQGVGSPPPLFSVPSSVSFEGAGNPLVPVKPPGKPAKKKAQKKKKKKAKGGKGKDKKGSASKSSRKE
jgi:hypothetical protein